MTKIELAGTIGTWVAVFCAIVALIGVVGPFVVWRASRTEKQIALKAVDTDLAENGGFISKGLQLWPGIRLFRSVRAPILRVEPTPSRTPINRSNKVRQVSKTSMSWVKLGLLIQSYQIPYSTGDSLIINESKTLLPISKVWVLILGLLGRFGNRKDKGKISTNKGNKAVPGWGMPPPQSTVLLGKWADSVYGGSSSITLHGNNYDQLDGLTGTLFIPRLGRRNQRAPIHFADHEPDEIGGLDCERLPLAELFWLAVGCIPCADGRVFSLENVQLQDLGDDDDDDETGGMIPMLSFPTSGFADDEGESDDIPFSRGISLNTYVQNQRPTRTACQISGIRTVCFSPTDQRIESLRGIARILQAERTNLTVMSLEEISVSNDDRAELEAFASVTYLPSDYMWVRLPRWNKPKSRAKAGFRTSFIDKPGRKSESHESEATWYLRRDDAQVLAQSLPRLPICRKGYLFSANKASLCYGLLSSAAPNAPHLLNYIIRHFSDLRIPDASRSSLLTVMQEVYRRMYNYQYSRGFMDTIYEMDTALQHALLPLDEKVIDAIGVLTISNPEFRDLITLAIRRIPQSADQTVKLCLLDPAIVLKSVLGSEQRFPVDLLALFPNFVVTHGTIDIDISFTNLILMVLKASVRSAFLKTSLDSLPLFERVMKLDDVVYVG